MANSDAQIECLHDLAMHITGSIKKHKVDKPRALLLVDVKLGLHLLDKRHDNVGDMSRILLLPLCKMVGSVNNVKQCKRIVNTSSKDIYKGNALDGCTITKYGHAKDSRFGQEQGHLLLPAPLHVDGIKVLATYKLPPWWLVSRTEQSCNLNLLQQLGVFSQGKWKAVAV